MNCNHCGSPIDPGKKFCGECGQPVAVEPPPTEAAPPIPDDIATELVLLPVPEEQWVLARTGQEPIVLGERMLFGRGTDCDFILDDTQASRRHALIEKGEEGYTLIDQDSSNGTFINEERVSGSILLSAGDVIRIGQTTFTFELAGEEQTEKLVARVDESKPAPPLEEVKPSKIEEPAERAGQVFCPECGARLTPGIAFCGECGHQFSDIPAGIPEAWDPIDSLEPQPMVNPKRLYFSRKGLRIGCLVIVGLGLALSCFVAVLDYLVGLLM